MQLVQIAPPSSQNLQFSTLLFMQRLFGCAHYPIFSLNKINNENQYRRIRSILLSQ